MILGYKLEENNFGAYIKIIFNIFINKTIIYQYNLENN